MLLGAIIESVAKQTYSDYLEPRLFGSLNMTRTAVDDKPVVRGNVAIGSTSFALGPCPLARNLHPAWEFAGGGLSSTVNAPA